MGYVCGFLGLFFPPLPFRTQFILLSGMLLCWCYPPRFGSLFKTSPLPGDDVTRPGAAGLARGHEGDRDPGPAPPVRLPSAPGSQLLSAGPGTLATGGEEAQSGGRPVCHPEPPPYRLQGGALPNRGHSVLLLLLFFSVLSSGPPTARSRDPRNWRGSGEGGRPAGPPG